MLLIMDIVEWKSIVLQCFIIVSCIIAIIIFLSYIFQYIHFFIGLFSKSIKEKDVKVNHKYGILIAARNESKVIGNLIESINLQNYPKELIKVFVVADNCTDNTKEIALKNNAIVFERENKAEVGKSYALDYGFKNILKDSKYNDLEAFFIFDADNLLSKDYIKEMNKLFEKGYKISTGFRASKNFDSSITSACSGLTFYRECLITHHSRKKMGLSTYVAGTGYYISKSLIEEWDGWPFHTMIEDIEVSCYCSLNNIAVGYNEFACFYDEQPIKLKNADKQRFRWCKGVMECHTHYSKKLFSKFIKDKKAKQKISTYEMFVHIFPIPVISISWSIIYFVISTLFYIFSIETVTFYFISCIIPLIVSIIGIYIFGLITAFVSYYKARKYIKAKRLFIFRACLAFPVFIAIYIPLLYKSLFVKNVKWEAIPHNDNTSIESIDK